MNLDIHDSCRFLPLSFMIFFQIHDSRRLLITYSLNDVLTGYLRHGKTGNKKRAICFATWLQNELNSVLLVLPPTKTNLASLFLARQGRTWVVKRATSPFNLVAAMLQNKLHVVCCPFYCSVSLVLYSFFSVQTSVFIQNYVDFGSLFLGIIIHFVQVWRFL